MEQASATGGHHARNKALPNGPGAPVACRFLTPTLTETEIAVSYWKHRAEAGSNPYTRRPLHAQRRRPQISLPLLPLPPCASLRPLRLCGESPVLASHRSSRHPAILKSRATLLSSGDAPKISNPFMKEFFHKENFSKPGASCWASVFIAGQPARRSCDD